MQTPSSVPIKAMVFDMDGVLFEGRNFWMDLHRRYGGDVAQARDLVDRYLEHHYETLAEVVVGELWRGKPADSYLELIDERRYQPGVVETFAGLRRRGVKTAIVSSGPDLLAERARRELGLDAYRANGIEIADGRLTGTAEIMVPDGDKVTVMAEVLADLGVRPAEAAAIGDGDSDIPTLECVGTPVAYDSCSPALTSVALISLDHGELPRLLQVVDERSEAAV